jgi:hypothetical protein
MLNESHLEVGSRVAVIDLRVFVPEVISVLATFADDLFLSHLSQIPFINRMIGKAEPFAALKAGTFPNAKAAIDYALQNSEIEYVQRLMPNVRAQLANQIYALKPVKSLYGTQLDAFVSSLQSSIHCTQGPPGTGKSYIGVCLALAFDVIRQSSESEGHKVGPILIMSYKNHALDEFLSDLIAHSSFHSRPGMLIRCGKPELEALQSFTESHAPGEFEKRDELSRRIAVIKDSKVTSKYWADLAREAYASSFAVRILF